MRLEKTLVIAKREYTSRIKSKGFWIATLLLPVLMAALIFLPVLLISKSTSRLDAVIVDETGVLGERLAARLAGEEAESNPLARVQAEVVGVDADREVQRAALDERLLDEEIDAWLWLDREGLAENRVEYHARSVSNTITQDVIEDALSDEVRRMRLTDAGYEPEVVAPLLARIDLRTVRVSAEGSRTEAGEAGFIMAYVLFFLLYIVLMIWGQQVLNAVLEEKTSRVVEVIISSARPFELMLGKLLGLGGAAFTQFGIWMVALVTLTAPGLISTIASLPDDVGIPSLSVGQALAIVAFFLLGFFVYSTLFAAVGASFNNLQVAQQLAWVPMSLIILPLLFFVPVINDTGGTLAQVLSLIPPLTPMLMPLRVAVEMPPAWEILLALALTAGFVWLMILLCGRIYRVGILMYGKKPTLKEIVRWVRYT
jgi:ABC-2 type transport system permease protein